MKLGHSADEIKYDATHGTIARYLVILDSEPTMQILCDSADASKTIVIAPAATTLGALTTAGRFTVKTELLEDVNGMPLGTNEQVDEKSVYTYVIPRLHVLLGRLLRQATTQS